MAIITCSVFGEPMEAGQCKCLSFSEKPFPAQTKPASTDDAIREGDPPYDTHSSPQNHPPMYSVGWMIKCGFIGAVGGAIGMGIYAGIEYQKETAPIPPTESVMAFSGLCCGAPVGFFFGIVVAGVLSSLRTSVSIKGSTQS